MKGVARIKRRLCLDQVAGEQHLVPVVPGDDVARGVAAAQEQQLELPAIAAQLDSQAVPESDLRPRESRY